MSLVDASARFLESDDQRRAMLRKMTPTQRDGLERWQRSPTNSNELDVRHRGVAKALVRLRLLTLPDDLDLRFWPMTPLGSRVRKTAHDMVEEHRAREEAARDWTPPPAPDWFEAPSSEALDRPHRTLFGSGHSRSRVCTVVESVLSGDLTLPPWQRGAVWTTEQRAHLLDSMVRGIPIGPITLWTPPRGARIDHRPFPGVAPSEGARLVIDGQQRLTTLLMAARGELDLRWDGARWSDGGGFMDARAAVARQAQDWLRRRTARKDWERMNADRTAVADGEVEFMSIEGSAAEMIETYRRLATCGSPHSLEDLAAMEAWRERDLPAVGPQL